MAVTILVLSLGSLSPKKRLCLVGHGVCTGARKTNSQSKECVSPGFFSVDVTYLPLSFHGLSLVARAGSPLPELL